MSKIPYGSILDSLKAIATKLNATLPQKTYSNEKDAIAGTLDAISDADIGGGGGGVVVEFNTYDNGGYDIGYVSVDHAADIVALYEAGNNIVFHFPEFPRYARESYMPLIAYLPANESVPEYTERFVVYESGLGYGDVFEVNDNGKLKARIYID